MKVLHSKKNYAYNTILYIYFYTNIYTLSRIFCKYIVVANRERGGTFAGAWKDRRVIKRINGNKKHIIMIVGLQTFPVANIFLYLFSLLKETKFGLNCQDEESDINSRGL